MKILNKPFYTFDDVLIQPQFSDIASREEIDTSIDLLGLYLKIPIISSNMDFITGSKMKRAMWEAGGLGILHRFSPWDTQKKEIFTYPGPHTFSVGTRHPKESLAQVAEITRILTNDPKIVCIDVAHGHHSKVIWLIGEIKVTLPRIKIIAGNVATGEAAYDLALAGADAVKVGIGPGSVCTTRIVTGVGVPQLSAIMEVADALKYHSTKIIADGGIRTSGDITKAIGAGADAVMLGRLLAGAQECPGEVIVKDGKRYRPYRGQSMFGVNNDERYVKEGVSGYVEEQGPVADILKQLVGGLRSGMSYVGARNIKELQEKTVFIPVSSSSLQESNHRMAVLA